MSILFLDTTYDVTLGVLNDSHEWLALEVFQGKKVSRTLQVEVHATMEKLGLELKSLKGIVTVAGPGFYTGLRLSEGFADVLKFFSVPHYSFYSYDILRCLALEGTWMTKAYRGEYFFAHLRNGEVTTELIEATALADWANLYPKVYVHSETALDDKIREFFKTQSTFELFRSQGGAVLKQVITENLQRSSYYFRAPEDEFRVSQ